MKVKLKALTPIFIGGGDKRVLSPKVDYVLGKEGVFLIDQARLYDILSKNQHLIEDYVNCIKGEGNIREFINELEKGKVITREEIKSLIKDRLLFKFALKDGRNLEIQRFISSPLGNYIPGSSIKGAIRTAIAYCYFKDTKEKPSSVLEKIGNDMDFRFAYKVVGLQFKAFSVKFCHPDRYDAKDDFLKILRVRDSKPIDQSNFRIFHCFSFHLGRNREGSPMFLECLDEGKEVEFEIGLFSGRSPIYEMASDFWSFIKDGERNFILRLLGFLNRFAKDFIQHERKYFKNRKDLLGFYNELERYTNGEGSALILLGRGTTFFGKTIDMVFTPDEFERMRDRFPIRQMGVIRDKRKNIKVKSNPFPITRILWDNGGVYRPLGWALLSVDK